MWYVAAVHPDLEDRIYDAPEHALATLSLADPARDRAVAGGLCAAGELGLRRAPAAGRRSRSTTASTNRRPRARDRPSKSRRGSRSKVRSDDEATLGNQIIQEGSSSPADVFYTENTPVLEALREHGLLAPVAPSTLAAVPSATTPRRATGWGSPARVSVLVYNTSQLKPSQLPSSILELAEPHGRASSASPPPRPTSSRWSPRSPSSTGVAAAERWLKGLQANGTLLPGQRDRRRRRSTTARARSGRSTTTTGTACARGRRERHALGAALLRPAATRATSSTSPGRRF